MAEHTCLSCYNAEMDKGRFRCALCFKTIWSTGGIVNDNACQNYLQRSDADKIVGLYKNKKGDSKK